MNAAAAEEIGLHELIDSAAEVGLLHIASSRRPMPHPRALPARLTDEHLLLIVLVLTSAFALVVLLAGLIAIGALA